MSFMRRAGQTQDVTVFVVNFTPIVRQNYRVGAPSRAVTGDDQYGCRRLRWANVGNAGDVDGRRAGARSPVVVSLTLPPRA